MSLRSDDVLLDGGLDRLGPLREPQRTDGLVQVEHVGGAAHLTGEPQYVKARVEIGRQDCELWGL